MRVIFTFALACFVTLNLHADLSGIEKPIIQSSCKDQIFETRSGLCAQGFASLQASAISHCTSKTDLRFSYSIDLDHDGTIDLYADSKNASGNYPIGKHYISWKVEDGCGGESFCAFQFEIRDSRPPNAHCVNGLSIDLSSKTNETTLYAHDIDQGSFDNCYIEDLRIERFNADHKTSTPPKGDQLVFDQNDLGTQSVNLWVKDVSGNWSKCNTYIVVQSLPSQTITAPTTNTKNQPVASQSQTSRSKETIDLQLVSIQPNPMQKVAKVKFIAPKATSLMFSVQDITGRVVYENTIAVNAGQDEFRLEKQLLSEPGIYLLTLRSKNQFVSQKFVLLP